MLNSTLLMSLVGSEILPASGILRSYLYLAPLVAGALMVINAIANILWNADPNKHDDTQAPALDALSGTEK
jgi:TRAP-type C4-dicarboxylate transport system permease small subunit